MRFILLSIVALTFSSTGYGDLVKHASNGTYGCRRAFGFGVYNPLTNKTAICWNGERMSIYVREFDHGSQRWSDSVKAKGLKYSGTWDYHNYPCISLAPVTAVNVMSPAAVVVRIGVTSLYAPPWLM